MSLRRAFLWLLGIAFVAAGANHFREPLKYLAITPPWVPWPELLNQIIGGAEILGGFGVLVPSTRRLAAWGLIAILIAVFPANLHMALEGAQIPGREIPPWAAWARLPFQLLFIAWVWWVALVPAKTAPTRA